MKRISKAIGLVLLIATTISSNTSAQENQDTRAKYKTRLGLKGGINFSNLFTEDKKAEKDNVLAGFNVGLFAKLPLAKFIAIQPELYFTTKGAEITYANAFVDGTAHFRLNYIELPVLVVVNITDNLNIHAGPYAAYLINGNVKNESNINLFDFEKNINDDSYNRFDGGLQLGAAIDIGTLSLGARYSYGLTKVGRENNFLGTSYTFPNAHNGVMNFYLAVSLN